ncbi:PD-(D/E)XK nuclease-like domain-containing protein [Sagittula salina]|uniref:PD-(D/E)XK nuclease-like domain-containing protein n=1 Tax=Sagittula salina TaxID=2820268 RepID=A0A940MVD0_9RHOB|nr:PD-(D/E)XK nuclease-like domain-containing protein [Sagittula salina]MBP0484647.1 PD-(D/E)XK nuclease-like domain-containing protein [Sagittula salina]
MNQVTPIEITSIKLGPGVYDDLPDEFYHGDCCAGPSISSTGLRQMLNDPADYWEGSALNPVVAEVRKRAQEEAIAQGIAPQKRHFDIGKSAHLMLLEPQRIGESVAVIPADILGSNGALSTKAAKTWAAQQAAAGRSVLKPEEWDGICDMADALASHREARALMAGCRIEQSHIWQDPQTGVFIKSRPDLTPPESGHWIVDYKTTDAATPDDWSRKSLCDFRLDIQTALQLWGANECLGIEPLGVVYIVQSKKKPSRIALRRIARQSTIGQDLLAAARLDIRTALNRFAICWETGRWPSVWDGPAADMIPPSFRQREIEAQLAKSVPDWTGFAA